jgi:hypothetical protein
MQIKLAAVLGDLCALRERNAIGKDYNFRQPL